MPAGEVVGFPVGVRLEYIYVVRFAIGALQSDPHLRRQTEYPFAHSISCATAFVAVQISQQFGEIQAVTGVAHDLRDAGGREPQGTVDDCD